LLGIVALFYAVRHKTNVPILDFPSDQKPADRRPLRIAFTAMALLYAALTFLLYLYNVRTHSGLMWETRHFLHRARLMEVYGLRPYVDFQSEYGPLLTVTPVYVHKLLKPLGSSLEQAYFVTHFLLNLAGVWCIYYVLSRARMPQAQRIIAFGLLAIAGFAPYMGLNGVLIRYLCPVACLLLGHRILTSEPAETLTAQWCVRAVFTTCLLLAINILLSPEAAVAFAIAWLGYAVLMLRFSPAILATSVVSLIAVAIVCWRTLPSAYYGSLLRFSEGANNLPLIPAIHLVFYVLTLFLIVPPLIAAGLRAWEKGDLPAAALCAAFGVLCVVMAPGALGRCDPPHVLFFGMVASMVLMIRLANTSWHGFAAYTIAYAGVFILFIQLVNLRVFFDVPLRRLVSLRGPAILVRHLRSVSGTNRPLALTLSALDRYPELAIPFASFGDPAIEEYVTSRGHLTPEYFVAIIGVYTPAALEHKLRDVGGTEYLLVPQRLATPAGRNQCQLYREDIRKWFLYPAKLRCRAQPLDPVATVSQFISEHYTPVESIGSWLILRRNSDASSG
jgi:hypothetical protein